MDEKDSRKKQQSGVGIYLGHLHNCSVGSIKTEGQFDKHVIVEETSGTTFGSIESTDGSNGPSKPSRWRPTKTFVLLLVTALGGVGANGLSKLIGLA